MNNYIILGSGRSGTSLIAGFFHRARRYMGSCILKEGISNPHGYHEDFDINELNNQIIFRLLKWKKKDLIRKLFLPPMYSDKRAFWLIPPIKSDRMKMSRDIEEKIIYYTGQEPFCYKDPRFNVALETWMPYLPEDTGFIVVFREPDLTVDSILRDTKEGYDPPLRVNRSQALFSWIRIYSHILQYAGDSNRWFFLHFRDMLNGSAMRALSFFSGIPIDTDLIDRGSLRSKKRDISDLRQFAAAQHTYELLCRRSEKDLRTYEFI